MSLGRTARWVRAPSDLAGIRPARDFLADVLVQGEHRRDVGTRAPVRVVEPREEEVTGGQQAKFCEIIQTGRAQDDAGKSVPRRRCALDGACFKRHMAVTGPSAGSADNDFQIRPEPGEGGRLHERGAAHVNADV